MSKFKRVSETEQLPNFMEQKFIRASVEQDDPYAHLRNGDADRRVRIARELDGYNADSQEEGYNFERTAFAAPQTYQSDSSRVDEWGAILSGRSVRRAAYDTDEGDNARDLSGSLRAFSDTDYMNVMLRGATIFDPEMEDLENMLVASAEDDNDLFDRRETRDLIADRKSKWEREAAKNIREPKTVMSRANAILRTSTENVSAGRFGVLDADAVIAAEERRIEAAEAKREKRLAIKREGKTLEEKAREWESSTELRPTNLRDIYSGGRLNLRGLQEFEVE